MYAFKHQNISIPTRPLVDFVFSIIKTWTPFFKIEAKVNLLKPLCHSYSELSGHQVRRQPDPTMNISTLFAHALINREL